MSSGFVVSFGGLVSSGFEVSFGGAVSSGFVVSSVGMFSSVSDGASPSAISTGDVCVVWSCSVLFMGAFCPQEARVHTIPRTSRVTSVFFICIVSFKNLLPYKYHRWMVWSNFFFIFSKKYIDNGLEKF